MFVCGLAFEAGLIFFVVFALLFRIELLLFIQG